MTKNTKLRKSKTIKSKVNVARVLIVESKGVEI